MGRAFHAEAFARRAMWVTRRATRADTDAWVRLCTASEGPDDYVLDFLDHFLARATTYVALDGDRFVGTMTCTDLVDGAAWLSAARTLPEYRGRGVASELVRALEADARSRGKTALRLWTAAANAAGIATFRKNGFSEDARFTRMAAGPAKGGAPTRFAPLRFDDGLESRVASSDFLARSKGYASYEYGFIWVNPGVLRSLETTGALLGWDEHAAVVSVSSEGYVEQALEVEPLAGDLASLLAEARIYAAVHPKTRVETFLPHVPSLLETARRAGFATMAWGQEAILCEKPLR